MANLRNKTKLASLNKEIYEENLKNNLAQNTSVAKSQEVFITQVSEEIENGITKKLSKELSRTDSRILGALSRLDEFLLNSLLQGHSGFATETSRNANNINQRTNEDDSQIDPHPEARVSQNQFTQVFGPDDSYDRMLACKYVSGSTLAFILVHSLVWPLRFVGMKFFFHCFAVCLLFFSSASFTARRTEPHFSEQNLN